MKIRSLLLLLCILLLSGLSITAAEPKAEKGVMDLSNLNENELVYLRLNGEWEFYWNKLLHPHDFASKQYEPDYYGLVPSYWTDYPKESVKTEKSGYATYRLLVILPHGYRKPLGFDLPVFDSSYDIYINDRYCGGNGIPGKSAEETEPGYDRNFFRYDPGSDSLSIVINVANFDHRRGGFWLPMKIGPFFEVQKRLANSWAANWAVISLLLGFTLFFFFFYLLSPKEKVMGFFSLATTGVALRPLFTSHYLINGLVSIGWTWIVRCEYIGLYLVVVGWVWFVQILYPTKYFRIFAFLITGFFSIAALLTLFLPVKVFSNSTIVIYPAVLILMIYSIIQSLSGTLKKNLIDFIYFLTFVLLVAGGIHDIKVALGRSGGSTGYIMTYLTVVFVMIQAALLLYRWVRSYHDKERLQNELEYMNRNLELLVNQRTQELKTRNEEVEEQSNRIALQNKKLYETIQMKNKIFSVISHDLRSPVVNILYMLNLLKEKEYRDKYDTFANSSIEYAQRVISLIENMLVWGRGQEDKIKYSPERLNLADIILTNLSIYKETTDKKGVYVNFTQVGSSFAYFDKDLMDIIIRNLLSNAVKYTQRGGRISILLKDKVAEDKGILLKFCDNGIGISPERLKNLFTSTEVTSLPGTENEKGTGIGLKLCHELIQINKGTINVESKEGEGTCISITLPV